MIGSQALNFNGTLTDSGLVCEPQIDDPTLENMGRSLHREQLALVLATVIYHVTLASEGITHE